MFFLFFSSGGWCNNPSEKMMDFVNGKDDIPYMTWKIIRSCSKPPTRWFPICLTKTRAFSGKIRRPSLPSDQSHLQLVYLQALWPPGRRGIEPENWWLNGGLPELYLENSTGFTEMESWRHEMLPTDMVVWWEDSVIYHGIFMGIMLE